MNTKIWVITRLYLVAVVQKELREDTFFLQVGGKFTADVLPHMADYGRVAVCGSISNYTNDDHSGACPLF